MPQPPPNTTVAQIVQLLAALDVSTISTHQGLRNAVLSLIERSAKDFRDEVAERIDSNKRNRKKPRKHTKEETQLLDYSDIHDHPVSADSRKVVERLGRAVKGLNSSLHIKNDAFEISNGKQIGQPLNAISFVKTTGCRQARIMQHLKMCEQTTHVSEGWRRLYMLWVIYELDRLMSKRTEPGRAEVADAVREFCRLSGEDEEVVRKIRANSHSYVTAANRENGLGIILMLGSRTTDAWERGRILDNNAVSWLWASCVSENSKFEDKAKALQRVACAFIRQGFEEYGIELDELVEEGHVFTRHFKAEAAPRNSPAGLEVLAAAIDQVESSRPESGPNVGHNQSTRDTQAHRQTRARDEGLIAGQETGLPPTEATPAPPATSNQQASWQMYTNGRSPATSGAPAGAHVPFAAAGQAQVHQPGSTSGNSPHGFALGTQAQAQPRPGLWNEGLVAEQSLQPAPYHGPRSPNGPTSNVPSQAGASLTSRDATATTATSPWQSHQQMAQPSVPHLNSYVGIGLIGVHNGGLPNADVFTQTVHENAFNPVQTRQQIAHGHDTHIQWPSYNEQTLHPGPDHADANTATQSVPSQCRPTNDYCQLQQNRVHLDPTTTDPGATHLRDGEDHLSDNWEEMINVLYSDLGYSTV